MRKFSAVTLEHHPIKLNEAASVTEACDQMRDRRAGSVLVTAEGDRLVGNFTGRDAVCRVLAQRRDPSATRLVEVMTPRPTTMSPDQTAVDALRLMSDGGFRHIPLVKNGKIWASFPVASSRALSRATTKRNARSGSTCAEDGNLALGDLSPIGWRSVVRSTSHQAPVGVSLALGSSPSTLSVPSELARSCSRAGCGWHRPE